MTEQPRDWDREMADIDQGHRQAAAGRRRDRCRPGSAPVTPQRRFVALTWFWTGLAVLLAVALLLWPYDRNCGIRLIFFIGAGGLALLAGVVGALNSWAHRSGLAHLLSLLVIVWAGVMADTGDPAPGRLRQGGARLDLPATASQCRILHLPAEPSAQPGT